MLTTTHLKDTRMLMRHKIKSICLICQKVFVQISKYIWNVNVKVKSIVVMLTTAHLKDIGMLMASLPSNQTMRKVCQIVKF